MRWLVVLLVALPAFAHEDCVAGAKHINLNNGSSTADDTGIVRCFDSDTQEETRSMSFLNGKLTGREKRKWNDSEAMEQEYRAGKRHGEYRKYKDENGAKKFERVIDGEQAIESRFDDLRESYTEGRLQGRRQAWFEDGSRKKK